MDPTTILITTGASLGSIGVVAAVTKLFSLGTGQARIETKLDDHIADERGKFDGFNKNFEKIHAGMNGEKRIILTRLNRLERHWLPQRGPRGKDTAAPTAARRRR